MNELEEYKEAVAKAVDSLILQIKYQQKDGTVQLKDIADQLDELLKLK